MATTRGIKDRDLGITKCLWLASALRAILDQTPFDPPPEGIVNRIMERRRGAPRHISPDERDLALRQVVEILDSIGKGMDTDTALFGDRPHGNQKFMWLVSTAIRARMDERGMSQGEAIRAVARKLNVKVAQVLKIWQRARARNLDGTHDYESELLLILFERGMLRGLSDYVQSTADRLTPK